MNRMYVLGVAAAAFLALACPIEQTARSQETGTHAEDLETKRLREEKEQLKKKIAEQDEDAKLSEEYIEHVTRSLNEVQDSLTHVTQKQNEVSKYYSDLIEKQTTVSVTQREELMNQVDSLQNQLAHNSAALAQTRREADANKKRVGQLVALVDHLQAEVDERTREIVSLRDVVAKMQVQAQQREAVIVEQQRTIAESNRVIEDQGRQNAALEEERDTVFYRVDTYDKLQSDGIIKHSGGLLGIGGVWMLQTANFAKEKFTSKNRYAFPDLIITMPWSRLQILSNHPKKSYFFIPKGRDKSLLHVLDAKAFWGGSPYLVIGFE
ncbi:MAG TPA: hypothetical protein VHU41_08160 [Thermoanaerobaculia bacterium]|jgi:chromosome segregation ATPase|nr:hypothetical protein [Thermoanaerobaculia bacterium]